MSNIPGVRITEVDSPSRGAAAASGHVPLLLGCFLSCSGDPDEHVNAPLWIDSYQAFLARFAPYARTVVLANGWGEPIVEKGGDRKQGDESPLQTSLSAMEDDVTFGAVPVPENNHIVVLKSSDIATGAAGVKCYFDNGGSPCYVMHCESEQQGGKIAGSLQEYNDITLYVALDDQAKVAMQTAFPLLQEINPQAMLITHQPYPGAVPPQPLPDNRQVATYTPALKFSSPGGELEEESTLLAGTGKTLAQLKVSDDERQREQYANVTARRNTDQFDDSILRAITLAPSGGVAGVFCKTERERGIWKAPANIQLAGPAPTHNLTLSQQAELTQAGFNPLLWSPRTGTVIAGARTADTQDLNGRFVSVRLLFNAVQRDLQAIIQPQVFEPNGARSWQAATAGIRQYLYLLWKRGGLQGLTPEQAFQVQVALDEDDEAQGVMRIRVALAPLRPAEFIELEFTQQLQVLA
ncbi:phage tail sheath family protein [Candidatus Pantoea multigeneris]|uniref:Phage tail sheath family protein n=1 Tax=Candidatus Pantoea multigeneris TaxID=2608357 RepID=A0ABX0R575_9GAMM|nr:phage tail sheath family protein [Pantoea multigeneris]NIF20557.1 phage tail sheath family protein [Pantoea multigeneris]